MKNIILALAIIFAIPLTGSAHDNDLKKLFEKYKKVAGFDLQIEEPDINFDIDGDWDLGSFMNNLGLIYVLDFEHHEGDADDLATFKNKLKKITDKKNYSTMVDIDGDERFALMIYKNDQGQTTDVLMISEEDNESTFIWATGN